ncbi:MAG: GFA family protein [Rhodospirillales bacterium]
MPEGMHVVTGGCMCGAVRYGAPEAHAVVYCHCKSCKKHTGAPVVCLAGYLASEIEWSGDERKIYNSSPGIKRGFCGKCGTPLTWEGHVDELGGDLVEVFISSTDDPDALEPEFHIWTDERIAWFDTVDELPRYHGWMHEGAPPFHHGPTLDGTGPKPKKE